LSGLFTTLSDRSAPCKLAVALTSPKCAGGTIPRRVTMKFRRGASLIDRAATTPEQRARRLLKRAKKALRKAQAATARAARGKKPKISRDCANVLRAAAEQVMGELGV